MQYIIVEHFEIHGIGTAVVLDKETQFNPGQTYSVEIQIENGETVNTDASMELLLENATLGIEKEAFLFKGLSKAQLPLSAIITLS